MESTLWVFVLTLTPFALALLQFEKYGRVLSVELKHGGFAFVEYEVCDVVTWSDVYKDGCCNRVSLIRGCERCDLMFCRILVMQMMQWAN